jgi:ubiquinone/menaquinone biosynthesis C-methylase UbiE
MAFTYDNHPELARLGIFIQNIDARYKPLMRMGISIDEMIYIARRLYPILKDSKRILDLACGNCLITLILSKLIKGEFHAIDDWAIIQKSDVLANLQQDKANIIINDFKDFTIPYNDSFFDSIYTVMYLSNIGKEKRIILAKEIKRVLDNNGRFVIVDTLVFRGKIKKEFEQFFRLSWYGEENGFSFFVWTK